MATLELWLRRPRHSFARDLSSDLMPRHGCRTPFPVLRPGDSFISPCHFPLHAQSTPRPIVILLANVSVSVASRPAAMPYQSVYAPHYSHYQQQQTNRPAAPPAAKPKKKQVSFGGATIIMYREPQQYQASQPKRKEAAPAASSKRDPIRYETLSRRPKPAVYEGRGEHVELVGRR